MLAMACGLMAAPKLLIFCEPSLGLAPLVTAQVFDTLGQIRIGRLFVLLSDQNVRHAISISNRWYVNLAV
jgi:branched-chain amino acid transport system ATP-binding protein